MILTTPELRQQILICKSFVSSLGLHAQCLQKYFKSSKANSLSEN